MKIASFRINPNVHMMRNTSIGLVFAFLPLWAGAQRLRKADKAVSAALLRDMGSLNQDTSGYRFVGQVIGQLGLTPGEGGQYVTALEKDRGVRMEAGTTLSLDGRALEPGLDFFVVAGSPDGRAEGTCGVSLNERDLPWIYDLRYDLEGGKGNPDFNLKSLLREKVGEAQRKGAKAMILYNSSSIPDGLHFDSLEKQRFFSIPVLYVRKKVAGKVFRDATADVDVRLQVHLGEWIERYHGVTGSMDGHAGASLVMAAHEGQPAGEAALIELVRLLRNSSRCRFNVHIVVWPEALDIPVTAADSDRVIDMDDVAHMDSLMRIQSALPSFFEGPEALRGVPLGTAPDCDREALVVRYLYKLLTAKK